MQIQTLFVILGGILSVKGTPFHPEASSLDFLNLNKESQQPLEADSKNVTLTAVNSNESLEVAEHHQGNNHVDAIHGSGFESTITLESIPHEHGHGHGHGHENEHKHGHEHEHTSPRKMGPVELGLRNVVSSSSIAAEELYMEMSAVNGETLDMVLTKSELLTSHAMNEIFKPLALTEGVIMKSPDCGRQFKDSIDAILSQVDSSLKSCVYNLTKISDIYKEESTTILSSISMAAEDMHNLPESCEIAQNFAAGTFCVVNNLAETNNRVVLDVKNMKNLNALAKEELSKAVSSTVACHKHLVEKVSEKLNKLSQEVGQKCLQTKPQN